ncbi:hypothetical protein GCM10023116_22440 [Kistimonas scapharcae]|uniref:Fido domain-containing protein n=1 Tax=Kistimonas scapharcae TaxID=1036133 RepID=A0ABP8V1Z5_9GAMM
METSAPVFIDSVALRSGTSLSHQIDIPPFITAIPTECLLVGYVLKQNHQHPQRSIFCRQINIAEPAPYIRKYFGRVLIPALKKITHSSWIQQMPVKFDYLPIANIEEKAYRLALNIQTIVAKLLSNQTQASDIETVHNQRWHDLLQTSSDSPIDEKLLDTNKACQFLSLMLELLLYRQVTRNDQRLHALHHMIRVIRESDQLTRTQKAFVNAFLQNAVQAESAIFQLATDRIAMPNSHHDTFYAFLIEDDKTSIGRHSGEHVAPYRLAGQVHALSLAWNMDIGDGITYHHLEALMIKLGHTSYAATYSEIELNLIGNFSKRNLDIVLNQSIIVCDTEEERKRITDLIRDNNITAHALFTDNEKDGEDLRKLSQRLFTLSFDLKHNKTTLKRHATPEDRVQETTKLMDLFTNDCIVLKEKTRTIQQALLNSAIATKEINRLKKAHDETIKKLMTLIIRVSRNILYINPFQSGNRDLTTILQVLLFRYAEIPYIALSPDELVHNTPEQLLNKLSEKLTTRPTIEASQLLDHPIFSCIFKNDVEQLQHYLGAGLARLVSEPFLGVLPLVYACDIGCSRDVIDTLLKAGAEIDQHSTLPSRRKEDYSPLRAALQHNTEKHYTIIEYLLTHGASTNDALIDLFQLRAKIQGAAYQRLRGLISSAVRVDWPSK